MIEFQRKLKDILDKAIELELEISKIYLIFSETFEEDKDFWWQLVIEEKNHAALLRSLLPLLSVLSQNDSNFSFLPSEDNLNMELVRTRDIRKKVENGEIKSREEAFKTAFCLENSSGELHFQKFLESEIPPQNEIEKVIRQLGRDDIQHAQRIKERAGLSGFSVCKSFK